LNAGGRLGRGDIERLPQDAVKTWQRVYNSLEGDDTLVRLLETLVILDTVGVTPRKEVVKPLHGYFSDERAAEAISRLATLGWVAEQSSRRETQIVIHDTQLEVIDFELNDLVGDGLLDFSDFLLDNRRIERLPDDLGAHLNGNFAEYVFEQRLDSRPVEDARRHFERAVELVRESPAVHVSYARFLEQRGAPTNEIVEQYEAAREIDPADGSISRQFCSFLERRNEIDSAIEVYQKGIKNAPSDTELRRSFAKLLERQDEADRAIEVYEEGLKQTPGDTALRRDLAKMLAEQDEVEHAIDIYEEDLEQNPGDTRLRWDFAELLATEWNIRYAAEIFSKQNTAEDEALRKEFADASDLRAGTIASHPSKSLGCDIVGRRSIVGVVLEDVCLGLSGLQILRR